MVCAIIMMLAPLAVSYTHLDVYKRQPAFLSVRRLKFSLDRFSVCLVVNILASPPFCLF